MSTDAQIAVIEDAKRRAEIDHSLRHPVMFFFTSGAAWLAVSLLLGCITSLKFTFPTLLEGYPVTSTGILFHAHLNTFIYGWGMQAAFGTMIWLMARLTRQPSKSAGLILTAGHVWNLIVALGTTGILLGKGTGVAWMAFPKQLWFPLLFTYSAIAVWSIIQFRAQAIAHTYVTQWYLMAAALWFPWVFLTGHYFAFIYTGSPILSAAAAAWFKSAMLYLWFLPVGIGAIYYLAPKVSGRPVFSYKLAMLGFWALAIIGPWAGMQKLIGGPIYLNPTYIGAAAAGLICIPCMAVLWNISSTLRKRNDIIAHSPTLRFTMASTYALVVLGALAIWNNLPDHLGISQFSISSYGFDAAALYGFFSMSMFGAIYFIVPRLTRTEWLSRRFIRWHFTFSVYGSVALALFPSFLGGYLHGQAQEVYSNMPWANVIKQMGPYTTAVAVAWFFILFSNVFFFLHLSLMWLRLGRRSVHPTLLAHHEDSDKTSSSNATLSPSKA